MDVVGAGAEAGAELHPDESAGVIENSSTPTREENNGAAEAIESNKTVVEEGSNASTEVRAVRNNSNQSDHRKDVKSVGIGGYNMASGTKVYGTACSAEVDASGTQLTDQMPGACATCTPRAILWTTKAPVFVTSQTSSNPAEAACVWSWVGSNSGVGSAATVVVVVAEGAKI
ncbi:hypothetical protein PIB30_020305 [Stylosanthes scabra]|uniref:Uncharacterized protein n=1 Tax=Stylosanthes scabra TaxID=79078 RepID=A0ABU6W875_9FABA|nr:hypothetical protein [Stylosanthes scabra]